jgi:hypothetical protein
MQSVSSVRTLDQRPRGSPVARSGSDNRLRGSGMLQPLRCLKFAKEKSRTDENDPKACVPLGHLLRRVSFRVMFVCPTFLTFLSYFPCFGPRSSPMNPMASLTAWDVNLPHVRSNRRGTPNPWIVPRPHNPSVEFSFAF